MHYPYTFKIGRKRATYDTKLARYFQSDGRYCYAHFTSGERILVNDSIGELEKALKPTGKFGRCHHGFLVNLDKVVSIPNGTEVVLDDKTELPLSRRKQKAFRKVWLANKKGMAQLRLWLRSRQKF